MHIAKMKNHLHFLSYFEKVSPNAKVKTNAVICLKELHPDQSWLTNAPDTFETQAAKCCDLALIALPRDPAPTKLILTQMKQPVDS